ncbi:cation:proton antiporter [Consotaella salsifontis]|uniref:Sodium/proton antiporter, CPA1 family n=1 Tax=Consotaella salsifontis TaxID=1365950 RepID=A0A1T4RCK0_9HYPH|nr:sodium/proton antiporter, CPA1 family [Consotaella salsifontis]
MDYILLLTVFGLIVLITAWVPVLIKEMPLSLPIICILIGAGLRLSPLFTVVEANPLESRYLTEKLTELVLIVSLMGAGLKLDRALGWRRWALTWRLLGISMPLSIAGVALVGWSLLGLAPAAALLLGAALAPTDPVLASDIQVGPPGSGCETPVRFALTSEAGLNDGLSFPFVYLAIAVALAGRVDASLIGHWFLVDVLWKLTAGAVIGWLAGKGVGWLLFRLPDRTRISRTGDGFVALGITLLVYGVTEIAHGYGFLAVFASGLAIRATERQNEYHEKLHAFAEQIERLLMMVLLVCFGAAIAQGSIFGRLDGWVVLTAVLVIFVIRPLAGIVGLLGRPEKAREKAMIAFFGIRGMGSFYYLAYALGQAEFAGTDILWVTICCCVLASIVLHGTTVTPLMRYLDTERHIEEGRPPP